MTKGLPRTVKNLRFTTVLSVRHVRSDERVDPRRHKFAFYLSFDRPTRPKWRKGRSDMWKICVLPQFWTSDTHEVTRGLSNPQVRSLRPRQKKNIYFNTFQTILISYLFSAVFSPVFQTAITSAKLSAVFSPVFQTAITSVELWAMFDDNL